MEATDQVLALPRGRWRTRAVRGVVCIVVVFAAAMTGADAAHAGNEAGVTIAAPDPGDPRDPGQTASPTPTPSPTGEPTPTVTPTSTPTSGVVPVPTATVPGPSPSPTPTTTATATATPTPTPAPAIPPAVATATIDLPMLLIAVGALIAAAILVWLLARRTPRAQPVAEETQRTAEPTPIVLDSMASLGAAMIDCGYPVGPVRSALEEMAETHGVPAAQAVVFPTSIMVSSDESDSVQTRVVSAGDSSWLLYQVDAVARIASVARSRRGRAAWVTRALAQVRMLPQPFSRIQRIGGYALLSAALSVLLGSSWPGVALAGVLGVGVGALLLATEQLGAVHRALIVVATAFGVGVAVLVVARLYDPGVLPALVAPLVMLLPGGLLTIGVIELATGDVMSGAARVAAGAMRLLLLAAGVVAAVALIGIPALTTTAWPLGALVPWVAVAVFGLGIGIYQCARPASIGWIVVVLYVAYAAQVIGDVFFDGVLSALVGAAAMTPVAAVVSRQRSGPPAFVSFLPAFWLLVPGALGLIGVAGVLGGDTSGMSTLVATIATMVSVALGVLIGQAATGSAQRLPHAPPDDWIREQLDQPDALR